MEPAVRLRREPELEDGTAIVAFPSNGYAATLAAAYLADVLGLEAIGSLEGDAIPAVAVIEAGQVVEPVRILAAKPRARKAKAKRLVLFLAELPLDADTHRAVAAAILSWCVARRMRTLIALEGTAPDAGAGEQAIRLWGTSTHAGMNAALEKAGLAIAEEGLVAGLTGSLLALGLGAPMQVVGLVENSRGPEPDVAGAAVFVEFLARYLDLPVDISRLRRDTAQFRKHLLELERHRRAMEEAAAAPDEQDFV